MDSVIIASAKYLIYAMVVGFALVWSAAQIFGAILAALLLRRKIGSIDGRRILACLARAAIAALPALLAGFGALLLLRSIVPNAGVGQAVLFTGIICALVVVIYLGVLALMRSPELGALRARLRRGRGAA